MNRRSGVQSRQNILDAARRVFADQGYDKASMRAIARQAGISVGGVYLYFSDKEELYLTLMKECLDYLNRLTVEALQGKTDPAEALTIFITISIDYVRSQQERIVLQGRELGLTFGLSLKQSFFRERRGMLENIIRQGIEQGVFRQCDARVAAKVIFNTLRGFVFSMAIDEEGLFSAQECANFMLNGLLTET